MVSSQSHAQASGSDARTPLDSALVDIDSTELITAELSATDSGNVSIGFDEESQRQIEKKWQRVRCYGFELAGVNCLAPVGVYCEILPQFSAEPLPNAPDYLLGLTNVRGNLVPVYQLEPLLHRPLLNNNYAILIGSLDRAGALLIARKPIQFDLADFTEAPERKADLPPLLQTAVKAVYEFEGKTWCLLNHSTLFSKLASTNSGRSPSSENTSIHNPEPNTQISNTDDQMD